MAKLVFDENLLTIGDLIDFDELVGVELQEALKPVPVKDDDGKLIRNEKGEPEETVHVTPKVLHALVWIANRHDNPSFSKADARAVKVTELDIIRSDDDDDSTPDEGKDEAPNND